MTFKITGTEPNLNITTFALLRKEVLTLFRKEVPLQLTKLH